MPRQIDNQIINYDIKMQAKKIAINIQKKTHIEIEGYKVSEHTIGSGGWGNVYQGKWFFINRQNFV